MHNNPVSVISSDNYGTSTLVTAHNSDPFCVSFFGSPLNWDYNPLEERIEKLRPTIIAGYPNLRDIQSAPASSAVVSSSTVAAVPVTKHLLGENEISTQPPKRSKIEPLREIEPAEEIEIEPQPAKNPEPLSTILPEQEPLEVDAMALDSLIKDTEAIQEQEEDALDEEESLSDVPPTNTISQITGEPVEKDAFSVYRNLTLDELALKFPNAFGEIDVKNFVDYPPSESEYIEIELPQREKDSVRVRKEPKRYNDAEYEEDEEEKKKKKTLNGKAIPLTKQLGLSKDHVILSEVVDPDALALFALPSKPFSLFDSNNNKLLQKEKKLAAKVFPWIHRDHYEVTKIATTDNGKLLLFAVKLFIRNHINAKTGKNSSYMPSYTFINTLRTNSRNYMRANIDTCTNYTPLTETPEIPANKLPRSSFELVLDYAKMEIVKETGFELGTTYLIKFSIPEVLSSGVKPTRVYRVKYQQMVQLRCYYYLANPAALLENIALTMFTKLLECNNVTLATASDSQINDLIALTRDRKVENRLLGDFVYSVTNFETFFNLEFYANMFRGCRVTADTSQKSSLLNSSKTRIKVI